MTEETMQYALQINFLPGSVPGKRVVFQQRDLLRLANGSEELADLFNTALMMWGVDPDTCVKTQETDPNDNVILTYTNIDTPGKPAFSHESLSRELGISTDAGKAALKVFLEAAILLDRKNKDYGPGNISAFGQKGVLVRLNDKVERLKTLIWGDKHPNYESIQDTWIDICNYGCIGLLCQRGEWK